MASSTTTLGERLRIAREAAGLTQDDVARHFQISRVSVTQWEADRTKPSVERLPAFANLAETSLEWVLEGKGPAPVAKPKPPRGTVALIPGEALVGEKDLPIYAAAMGGDGHVIVSFDPIDYVKRPSALQNVRGGYGIMVTGESMIPAYWPGDVGLVHPHLQATRDTDVVLYHTPPSGREAEAIVKRLVGFNDREWTLEQYRPALVFKESRVEWPICHRLVGRYNAR